MADKQFEIAIKVKATSEDAALSLVQKQLGGVSAKLKETAQGADQTKGSFGGLGGAVGKLAGMLGGLAILTKITGWMKEGTLGAIAEERAIGALSTMVKQFDPNIKDLSSRLEEYAEKMEKVGMEDDLVYAGIRQLIPVTKDYENSTKAVGLAWDVSVAMGIPYQQSLDLIAGLIANNPRSLKMANRELGVEAKTCQEALDKMFGQFDGYSTKIQDHKTEIDRLKNGWADFKEYLGGTVLVAYDFWTKIMVTKTQTMAVSILKAIQGVTSPGGAAWGALQGLITKAQGVIDSAKTLDKGMVGPQQGPRANKPDGDTGEKTGGSNSAAVSEALGIPSTDDIQNDLNAKLKVQQNYYLQSDNMAKMSAENKKRMDEDYARHVERINDLMLKDVKIMSSEDLKVFIAELKKEEQYFKQHQKKINNLSGALSDADIQLSKKTYQEKAGVFADYASVAGQMTGQLFEQNKKGQIATAIINTIAGAARAFADYQYPMSLVIAALALVSGYAQVSKIQSTKMDSAAGGYDIPSGINPIVQTHAKEMILPERYAEMFRRMEARESSTTNNNYGGNRNITVNALTGHAGAMAALKTLHKEEKRYNNLRVK